jgi:hypothetical protein
MEYKSKRRNSGLILKNTKNPKKIDEQGSKIVGKIKCGKTQGWSKKNSKNPRKTPRKASNLSKKFNEGTRQKS